MDDTLKPPDSNEEAFRDFDEILREALSLSPGLREILADHLLASLDDANQKKIDAAWAEELNGEYARSTKASRDDRW